MDSARQVGSWRSTTSRYGSRGLSRYTTWVPVRDDDAPTGRANERGDSAPEQRASKASRSGEKLMELRAERMVHGGRALARLASGEVALVSGAIPGELVRAELEQRRGVWLGRTVAVLESSPDRLPTPVHPGLDYGFMNYPRQLSLKAEVVADSLHRVGLPDAAVPELVAAPLPWGYRSVVQPACDPAGLGYRRPGSGQVVVQGEDEVATSAVNTAWRLALELRAHRAVGAHELVIRANDDGQALIAIVSSAPARKLLPLAHALVGAGIHGVSSAPYDPRGRFRQGAERLAGKRDMLQRYGDFELTVNATSFAQPNPSATTLLYRAVKEWAGSGTHAWELFAGGGAIAFHLTERFGAVTALEVDRAALARGERDAERLGVSNLRFVRGDARRAPLPSDADLLVVDPPRAGLARELRAAIGTSGVPRLLYVSCDVASWARDVVDLEARGYQLTRFQPFDLYPQTHHIELLSELVLKR